MATFITRSAQETMQLGSRLAKGLAGGETIAFTGGLGVGKTTLCRGIAEGLACVDPVSSPTFAIANLYRGRVPFAHMDAYRIATEQDLETAGLYDYLEQGAVVAVEWSERVAPFLPRPLIHITMRILSQDEREIVVKGADWL